MGHETFLPKLKELGIDYENDKSLIVKEYFHNMDICTAAADLIICRSGASTISELQAMGRASVLIPKTNKKAPLRLFFGKNIPHRFRRYRII